MNLVAKWEADRVDAHDPRMHRKKENPFDVWHVKKRVEGAIGEKPVRFGSLICLKKRGKGDTQSKRF